MILKCWFFCFDYFIKLKSVFQFLIVFLCNVSFYFYSLPNGEYSNPFIATAFSSKSFSGKRYLPVKNLYWLIFPDGKAVVLAVYLSKLYQALFCTILLPVLFNFLTNTHFYNKLFLIRNGLSDDKVLSFSKSQYGSLYIIFIKFHEIFTISFKRIIRWCWFLKKVLFCLEFSW